MVAGLSYYLALKFKPENVQALKALYEEELQRALQNDGSSSSLFVTPRTYFPEI
jgi:hypothetical protein